jgi:SAM-dependent methyltransferase
MQSRNVKQKEYYEDLSWNSQSENHSLATNIWRGLRNRAMNVVSNSKRQDLYELHKEWMDDLSDAKVLDLGVGTGSRLTNYIAKNSREYHALDLSAAQTALLKEKLKQHSNCVFHVVDFLSDDFMEANFDVIYAHSVFHHFDHLDVLSERCLDVLNPRGMIITYDPIVTWLPMKILRALYRPFQSDSDWEHPFTSSSVKSLKENFDFKAEVGLFRRSKWAILLGVMWPAVGQKLGDKLFEKDLNDRSSILSQPAPLTVSLLLKPAKK